MPEMVVVLGGVRTDVVLKYFSIPVLGNLSVHVMTISTYQERSWGIRKARRIGNDAMNCERKGAPLSFPWLAILSRRFPVVCVFSHLSQRMEMASIYN